MVKKRCNNQDKGSGDSSDGRKIKSVTDTTIVTNVIVANARKGGKMFEKR